MVAAPSLVDVGIATPNAAFHSHKEGKEERGNIDSRRLILTRAVAALWEALKRWRKEHPGLSRHVVRLCLLPSPSLQPRDPRALQLPASPEPNMCKRDRESHPGWFFLHTRAGISSQLPLPLHGPFTKNGVRHRL